MSTLSNKTIDRITKGISLTSGFFGYIYAETVRMNNNSSLKQGILIGIGIGELECIRRLYFSNNNYTKYGYLAISGLGFGAGLSILNNKYHLFSRL